MLHSTNMLPKEKWLFSPKVCYHTSCENMKASGAAVSLTKKVHVSAMLFVT